MFQICPLIIPVDLKKKKIQTHISPANLRCYRSKQQSGYRPVLMTLHSPRRFKEFVCAARFCNTRAN